jgi:hypothetical protein
MRMLMVATMPVEAGNAAVRNGTIGATIKGLLDDLKPEAAYFTEQNGERSAFVVFDMKDTSQIPGICEPWFLAFNAKVSLRPLMNAQDLATAGPGIERAVKMHGKAV